MSKTGLTKNQQIVFSALMSANGPLNGLQNS